jgi:hypothetical protein
LDIEGIKAIIAEMNDLKHRGVIKKYAIGGSVAVMRYTEPFFTKDLDLFVILQGQGPLIDMGPLWDHFRERGALFQDQWLTWLGVDFEFLPPPGELEEEAIEQANEVVFDGVPVRVFAPEYLIGIYLKIGDRKRLSMIDLMLEQYDKIDMDRLYEILGRYGLREKFNGLYPQK